jgi:hypothetical protein
MNEPFREKWYLGLPGRTAEAQAQRDGWYVRVVSEGRRFTGISRPDRVSLELDAHGIVVSARVC